MRVCDWALSMLFPVECVATVARTTAADNTNGFVVEAVVEGEFLACADGPPAEEENVPASFSDPEIRIATVIDEFSATAADGTIDKAARVQAEEVKLLDAAGAPNFIVADAKMSQVEPLSGVFHDPFARRDWFGRKYTHTVDLGAANPEPEVRGRRID